MTQDEKEAMEQAISQIKTQIGPLVEVADYMLETMATSGIPKHISTFIRSIRESLIEDGFTREEAVSIIMSLDITGLLKQEKVK